ncbi:MAG: hypothetical protein C0404_02720 [Verrucomicrobia bacterium]|nr:hypothetical protein [Verrucomicrobiota bacterium]
MMTRLFALSTLLVLSAPCLASDVESPERLVQANNKFTMELYRKVKGGESNLFLSPYGISSTLTIMHAGAQGDTARGIAEALRFDGIPQPETRVPEYAKTIQQGLGAIQRRGDGQFAMIHSLWAHKAYRIDEDFMFRMKSSYTVEANSADFAGANEDARKKMNAWVDTKTRGRIKDLVKSGAINDRTRLVLANAVWFKAKWEHEFFKRLTVKQDFDTGSGKKVQVDLMTQAMSAGYATNDEVEVLQLAYKGGSISMIVVVPKKAGDLAKVEDKLSPAVLNDWMKLLKPTSITLSFPRFRFSSEFDVTDTLRGMGMKDAFDSAKADFSRMNKAPEKLFISTVMHKACVDVDEEGTEASAAAEAPAAGAEPPPVRVDRSFLFLVRENKYGSILFIGRVVDPSKR